MAWRSHSTIGEGAGRTVSPRRSELRRARPELRIRFVLAQEDKTGPNQMHFDLTSMSLQHQYQHQHHQQTVARVLDLGGSHLAVGQLPEEGHVVLAWAVVWDQDQETATQSPPGGTKITWGGPPVAPRTGRNRLRFDLAGAADRHHQVEVDRLVSLGATRIDGQPRPAG